jgi:hypothetical protein
MLIPVVDCNVLVRQADGTSEVERGLGVLVAKCKTCRPARLLEGGIIGDLADRAPRHCLVSSTDSVIYSHSETDCVVDTFNVVMSEGCQCPVMTPDLWPVWIWKEDLEPEPWIQPDYMTNRLTWRRGRREVVRAGSDGDELAGRTGFGGGNGSWLVGWSSAGSCRVYAIGVRHCRTWGTRC